MKRQFIPISELEMYDDFHMKDGDSFVVNKELDGNDTEYHKQGVEVIKDVLQKGAKVLPILVYEDDGKYYLLDGFKRSRAHVELGYENIEAFVCNFEEYNGRVEVPFHGKMMRAYKGGQPFEEFGLLEAGEQKDFNYDNTKFLFKSEDPHGLRIEVSECIHVHWGEYGRYRLALGRRDFLELAEAVSSING